MITRQAIKSGAIYTVPSGGVSRVVHYLHFPTAACPVSRNPVLGCARITYTPADQVAEVVALDQWLVELAKPKAGNPRNVEGMAARMAADLRAALGVPVVVDLYLLVRPWQILHVRA